MKAGVQAIIQKIQIDAEEHSNERRTQIMTEIDEEIVSQNADFVSEIERRRDMLVKHNQHEFSRLKERLGSRLNRELLTYQHDLLNEIFDMAIEKLRNASEKEFYDMFCATIKGLKGNFTLYMGELSEGKLDASKVREALEGEHNLEIALSTETIYHKSGFVLRDNRIEYDCLFEDLIDDMKNEQIASILKEVFFEEG